MSSEFKPAIAYVRVSTDEQTVENQKIAIDEWAHNNGYLVIKYYEDEAISGKIPPLRRQGFKRL
ncbi:MAG: recombinase family protein, partial [Candidatus Bathyarchaeia archaeon]